MDQQECYGTGRCRDSVEPLGTPRCLGCLFGDGVSYFTERDLTLSPGSVVSGLSRGSVYVEENKMRKRVRQGTILREEDGTG